MGIATVTKKTKNIIFGVVLRKPGAITYNMIKSRMKHEDIGEYITYGIGAVMDGITLDEVKDISMDAKAVKNLVNKCNYHSLAMEHFRDVVEDFILR